MLQNVFYRIKMYFIDYLAFFCIFAFNMCQNIFDIYGY